MFTGIIEAIGSIEKIEDKLGDKRFTINTGKLDLVDVAIGDSIACNGVCLTVIELTSSSYIADVSVESLSLTTLGNIALGSPVNLEKALTPTTRLGGHLVSGHVDGIGKVIAITKESRSICYDIQAPKELSRYIAKKGSVTVDGISLTVNDIEDNVFKLNLVPHTLQETNAKNYQIGAQVNLEVDLLARYLERLLLGQKMDQNDDDKSTIDYQKLINTGFIK